MKIMATTVAEIRGVFVKTLLVRQEFSWKDVLEAVYFAGIKIDNWMQVRNVLQEFIDADQIKRTNDVHKEIYTVL